MDMGGLGCQKSPAINRDQVPELLTCSRDRTEHPVGQAVPGGGMHMFGRVRKGHSSGGTLFSWRVGVQKNSPEEENGGVWNRKKKSKGESE